MNKTLRNRLVTILAVLLVFIAGIWVGGHPSGLPTFASDALVKKTPGRVYDQALGLINSEYYRKVDSNKLVNIGIAASVDSLHDPFSSYFSPKNYAAMQAAVTGNYQGIGVISIPVAKGLKVLEVFNNSPAKKAGFKQGDIITAVNGQSIAGKAALSANKLIRGKAGTDVTLTVASNGGTRTVKVLRAQVKQPLVVSSMKEVNGVKIGYVDLREFDPGAADQVKSAVNDLIKQGAQGIVLDLRDNPGGLIQEAIGVASIFIPSGTIVTTKGRTVGSEVDKATGGAISGNVPVVVLVNNYSASSAEIVTAALQDHKRAVVVGQHTFGKGVFQEFQTLPNGGAIELVAGEYFTPNGRNLGGGGIKRGAGVKPNIVVINPNSGPDKQLAVALQTAASKAK